MEPVPSPMESYNFAITDLEESRLEQSPKYVNVSRMEMVIASPLELQRILPAAIETARHIQDTLMPKKFIEIGELPLATHNQDKMLSLMALRMFFSECGERSPDQFAKSLPGIPDCHSADKNNIDDIVYLLAEMRQE
jgi:hypothetical protein